jgi:DNA-binding MarR family transcriptional regulator
MMGDLKHTFAPVPARAMPDDTLTALDLRVLMVLAAHDRFGANGIGCYASHPRLAGLVKCHLKSLSRCLRVLAEGGYVEAAPHPLNRRLRVYRVIYTEADRAVIANRIGNESVTDRDAIGNELAPETGAIGNRDFQEAEEYQGDAGLNILGEAYKISRETVEDSSAEAVLRNEGKQNGGSCLDAELQRFAIVTPSGAVRRVGVRTDLSLDPTTEKPNRARAAQT